jgi:Calcineurin-like phosphoesterase
MIPRQALERHRVLLQAERLRDFIDGVLSTGTEEFTRGDPPVQRGQLIALKQRLHDALQRPETSDSANAYVPRDPTLGNLQSLAVNELTVKAPLRPQRDFDLESSQGTSALETLAPQTGDLDPVTTFSVADKVDDALGPRRLEGARHAESLSGGGLYGPDDPLWGLMIGLAEAWRGYEEILIGKYPFNESPAGATLGEHSRLFLVGDWGTGIERAQRVANHIHEQLASEESRARDCHVIHLGDTYFAGWWWEQQLHIIDHWPVREDVKATSWALAGNHDYYSGGDGYFDWLLRHRHFTNQVANGRPTSIFELANKHWCVLGLDSSWIDHDLPEAELKWLRSVLNPEQPEMQKVILLSHHQPWSAFGDGPHPPLWKTLKAWFDKIISALTGRGRHPLWTKLEPLIRSRPLEAWFWGHEHRLAIYKTRRTIQRPRLLGNGGVPTPITDQAYITHPKLLKLDYEVSLRETPGWCRFAFARIDLDPKGLTEAFFDEYGNPIDVQPTG